LLVACWQQQPTVCHYCNRRAVLWRQPGAGVLQKGRFVKTPRGFSSIQVVRDTKLLNGVPGIRVTHVAIETRLAGRGELTIAEYLATALGEDPESPGSNVEPTKRLLRGSLIK
jgi:hypothetical protein